MHGMRPISKRGQFFPVTNQAFFTSSARAASAVGSSTRDRSPGRSSASSRSTNSSQELVWEQPVTPGTARSISSSDVGNSVSNTEDRGSTRSRSAAHRDSGTTYNTG
ncbi:hypothetical protein Agub_g4970, partial [Astrephomene gubernaculifera]